MENTLMFNPKPKLLAMVVCLAFSAPTLAMKGSELDKLLSDQTVEGDAYLSGLADGFSMRDALRMKPDRYEYCQPVMDRLTNSDYRTILQVQLSDPAKQAYITHLPAYMVLLMGMHEKYPCPKSQ